MIIGTLLLTGCGGAGGGSADSAGVSTDGPPPESGVDAQRLQQDAPGLQTETQKGSGADGSQARGGQAPQVSQAAFRNRERIHTASVTVKVDEVGAAGDTAERIVTGAGGYVHSEKLDTSGGRKETTTATLTLKVPPEKYRDVLAQLQNLGERVDLDTSTEDVTGEVADIESRITSAEASIERLRGLLKQASSVNEVIQVEQELADREAELESLQGRLKALEARISYATVTLTLKPVPKKEALVVDDDPPGFLAGLYGGWGALAAVGTWLAAALGATLPFLVVLALAGAATWWVRGQVRRRRAFSIPGETDAAA